VTPWVPCRRIPRGRPLDAPLGSRSMLKARKAVPDVSQSREGLRCNLGRACGWQPRHGCPRET
jgi:hypothetical protein